MLNSLTETGKLKCEMNSLDSLDVGNWPATRMFLSNQFFKNKDLFLYKMSPLFQTAYSTFEERNCVCISFSMTVRLVCGILIILLGFGLFYSCTLVRREGHQVGQIQIFPEKVKKQLVYS